MSLSGMVWLLESPRKRMVMGWSRCCSTNWAMGADSVSVKVMVWQEEWRVERSPSNVTAGVEADCPSGVSTLTEVSPICLGQAATK